MTTMPADQLSAEHWAQHWIAAWNTRDVEAVLRLFADDCRFRSPKAATITGHGTVHGKPALRAYWQAALVAIPSLQFSFEGVHWDPAARSLLIRYVAALGAQRLLAAEIFDFDDHSLVACGTALYGAPAD
ncbi:MAG: nuclear transport factor 2 family protein [Nevskia sp.]|nr:nuclear transport factor 2 family protein [Nevskia sp.]